MAVVVPFEFKCNLANTTHVPFAFMINIDVSCKALFIREFVSTFSTLECCVRVPSSNVALQIFLVAKLCAAVNAGILLSLLKHN